MNIAELAKQNHIARRGLIAGLKHKVRPAKDRANQIYEARKTKVADSRSRLEFMQEIKRIPGFFPTPAKLVDQLIDSAELFPGCHVLEPSAGKGDLIKGIIGSGIVCSIVGVEINKTLRDKAQQLTPNPIHWGDFLEVEFNQQFDRVVMNPPFEKRQDQKHIEHAATLLKPGGLLVAICSSTTGERLSSIAEYVEPLPAGSFQRSERPTGVNTSLVVIRATNE